MEIEGMIKMLTINHDVLGDIYFVIFTDAERQTLHAVTTEIAGKYFGLKNFLGISDGSGVASPESTRDP